MGKFKLDGRTAFFQFAQLAIGVEDAFGERLVLADGFGELIGGVVQMLFVDANICQAMLAPMQENPKQGRHENGEYSHSPARPAPCARSRGIYGRVIVGIGDNDCSRAARSWRWWRDGERDGFGMGGIVLCQGKLILVRLDPPKSQDDCQREAGKKRTTKQPTVVFEPGVLLHELPLLE